MATSSRQRIFAGAGALGILATLGHLADAGRAARTVPRTHHVAAAHSVPVFDKVAEELEKRARGAAAGAVAQQDHRDE
jgi:hypothetical protein